MEPHCCCWLASKIGTCYSLLIFFQDLLASWKDGEKKLVEKLWWVLAWRDAFVFFFPILIHVCVFMQHFIRHFITEFTAAAAMRIAWPPRKDVKNCLQGPSLVSFSPTTILHCTEGWDRGLGIPGLKYFLSKMVSWAPLGPTGRYSTMEPPGITFRGSL